MLDQWAEEYFTSSGMKLPKVAVAGGRRPLRAGGPRKQPLGKGDRRVAPPPLPQYNPVDVINHFVKMEHERELARLATTEEMAGAVITPPPSLLLLFRQKPPTPPPATPPEPEEEVPRTTVVPLPQLDRHHQRLVRLGETHVSCCHPERETTLSRGECHHSLKLIAEEDSPSPPPPPSSPTSSHCSKTEISEELALAEPPSEETDHQPTAHRGGESSRRGHVCRAHTCLGGQVLCDRGVLLKTVLRSETQSNTTAHVYTDKILLSVEI